MAYCKDCNCGKKEQALAGEQPGDYSCGEQRITLYQNNDLLDLITSIGAENMYHQDGYQGKSDIKYKNLDDNFFNVVDTEAKAYLLGWIASDGHISDGQISIEINKNDSKCIEQLRDIICKELPIYLHNDLCSFTINSKIMVSDICRLLQINPGNKSRNVQFPDLLTDELKWSFLRGYFDGNGTINIPDENNKYPKCSISSNSDIMLQKIKDFCQISCSNNISFKDIYWSHNNALDFLGKIYNNSNYYLERKKDLFLQWSVLVPSLIVGNKNGEKLSFKWCKTRNDAIPPTKTRISDSGYDLTLLEKIKTVGDVEFYDTGIKVQPDYGLYFDVVPRSSISKTGYMLANSVGIIDRTYIGNIIVALRKVDKNAPDLELPIRFVQLIPRHILHLQSEEVEELDDTERGAGGFGSTGIK